MRDAQPVSRCPTRSQCQDAPVTAFRSSRMPKRKITSVTTAHTAPSAGGSSSSGISYRKDARYSLQATIHSGRHCRRFLTHTVHELGSPATISRGARQDEFRTRDPLGSPTASTAHILTEHVHCRTGESETDRSMGMSVGRGAEAHCKARSISA